MKECTKIFLIRKTKKQNFWTNEEDETLLKAVNLYNGKKWNYIAKFFKNKNNSQCLTRYNRIRPDKQKSGWNKFSPEEDKLILEYVLNHGKYWTQISKLLSNRNGKQIRNRYVNFLDNTYSKEKFTKEEDDLITAKYLELGTKWSKISMGLPRRTSEMVKNRFYSYIHKRLHPYDIDNYNKLRCRTKNIRLSKKNTVKHKKYFEKIENSIKKTKIYKNPYLKRLIFKSIGSSTTVTQNHEHINQETHSLLSQEECLDNDIQIGEIETNQYKSPNPVTENSKEMDMETNDFNILSKTYETDEDFNSAKNFFSLNVHNQMNQLVNELKQNALNLKHDNSIYDHQVSVQAEIQKYLINGIMPSNQFETNNIDSNSAIIEFDNLIKTMHNFSFDSNCVPKVVANNIENSHNLLEKVVQLFNSMKDPYYKSQFQDYMQNIKSVFQMNNYYTNYLLAFCNNVNRSMVSITSGFPDQLVFDKTK